MTKTNTIILIGIAFIAALAAALILPRFQRVEIMHGSEMRMPDSEIPDCEASDGMFARMKSMVASDPGKAKMVGDIYYEKHKYEQALHFYQIALSHAKEKAPIMELLGNIRFDTGEFKEAVSWYEKVMAVAPSVDVSADLGICLYRTGKIQEAINQFQKGLEMEPEHAITLYNMGVVYDMGLGQKETALRYYRQVADLEADDSVVEKAKERIRAIETQ